jgi:hypothetical protein
MRLVPFLRTVLLALLALNAAVRSADAQALRCSAILPGETVSRVAMRMTGSAEYRHQPWFQVVVPDTGTLIAKSSYDDVQAGWRACLMSARGASRHPTPSPSAAAFFGVPIRWLNGANLELLLLADLGVVLDCSRQVFQSTTAHGSYDDGIRGTVSARIQATSYRSSLERCSRPIARASEPCW